MTFFSQGDKANTQAALRLCREQMFRGYNGDRDGVPNIAVLVSDGDSDVRVSDTQTMARALRDEGVEVYVVAVGGNPRIGELNGIASDPDDAHVFYMADLIQVNRAADKLTKELCQ